MSVKRILGIDFGDKQIGLALTDPLAMFAQPLASLENTGKKCIKEIAAIVEQNDVGTVVVGMPYELDGSIGPQAKIVKRFFGRLERELLEQAFEIELLLWDERLTTAQAERILAGSGLRNRDRSAALDRISAALILESYMNSRAN